ncbi:MAG TPA: hypothetical protein VMU29_05625 [Smithella sp.]|nr:hypothetical protein [Smithella sp.]
MTKGIQKKMAELTEIFVKMTKDNQLLNDTNDLDKQIQELMKKVAEKQWNDSSRIYGMLKAIFKKYKDNIKIINTNEVILKKTMSKLKNLYKDEILKKIKEAESLKITNDAFALANNTFKNYEDSLKMMNKQFEIAVDSFKEIKDSLKSEKTLVKKSLKQKSVKKNKTQLADKKA